MIKEAQYFDNFPWWMVTIAGIHNVLIYGLGIYILSRPGIFWAILYVLYLLWIEFRVLKYSCKDCYYYAKLCCLGRSRIVPLFFRKGDPQKFWLKETSRLSMLPDFLVPVIPTVVGIIFLIADFSVLQLFILILLIVLYTGGNAFVRGSLACKHCKQREIRCPAEEMFSSKKSA
jgi:hypothetical protein